MVEAFALIMSNNFKLGGTCITIFFFFVRMIIKTVLHLTTDRRFLAQTQKTHTLNGWLATKRKAV